MDLQFLSSLFNITKRPLAAMAGGGISCITLIYLSWSNEEVSELAGAGWLIPMFVGALLLGAPIGVAVFGVGSTAGGLVRKSWLNFQKESTRKSAPKKMLKTLERLPADERSYLKEKLIGRRGREISTPDERGIYLFRRLENKGVLVAYTGGFHSSYYVTETAWLIIAEKPETVGMTWFGRPGGPYLTAI